MSPSLDQVVEASELWETLIRLRYVNRAILESIDPTRTLEPVMWAMCDVLERNLRARIGVVLDQLRAEERS